MAITVTHRNLHDLHKLMECGALVSHACISPSGDVKLCPMDRSCYFKDSLGNALSTSIKDIYDSQAAVVESLANLVPPNYEGALCRECDSKYFCHPCVLRGLLAVRSGHSCPWFDAEVPSLIRSYFHLDASGSSSCG